MLVEKMIDALAFLNHFQCSALSVEDCGFTRQSKYEVAVKGQVASKDLINLTVGQCWGSRTFEITI